MEAILTYSIGISIPLILMWAVYHFTLSRTTLHRFNRAVLLLIYLLALAVIPIIQTMPASIPNDVAINIGEITTLIDNSAPSESGTISLSVIVLYIYIAVAGFLALKTLLAIARTLWLIKSSRRVKSGRFTIAIHNYSNLVPFSWGKWVVISQKDFEEDGQCIIAHECAHLSSRHWLDLLVAEAVIIINWFNPAAWMLRLELHDLHEYSADSTVLQSNLLNAQQYQLLLIKKTAGTRFAAIANSLNHSSLKKRITMMLSKKSRSAARMRALALVPATALALIFVNNPVEASTLAPAQTETAASPDKGSEKTVYNSAEVMPKFPGGNVELMKFIAANIKYPKDYKGAGGRVIVKFTVSETGKVTDAEIMRGQDDLLNAEALRVVGILPDFTPGQIGGKNVAVEYVIPISFAKQ